MKTLEQTAFERRLDVLEMVNRAKTGHIGGSMSCLDVLTVLYYHTMDTEKIRAKDPNRDYFILSKGHCGEALYTILADLGFFEKEELATYAAFDTRLAEHPNHRLPGIEIGTGALGHGLCIAAGIAHGLRLNHSDARVYTLMGDGEQAEGSNWEAAMAAAKYGLSNLTAIVDRNRLQISGTTEEVMPLDDLAAKYAAFGWHTAECNGHNAASIIAAFATPTNGKPLLVVANTIKGYGSTVMENQPDWHHLVPSAQEYAQIKQDLTARKEAVHG